MATTSYSPLPSSSYPGLGSQGDLFHSANYGAYDTGIGSITSHPYQYETTNYRSHITDSHQASSYADDFLRSNHSNNGYSTQQPQYYPTDRYAQQPTYNLDSTFNDYTNAETRRYNDENYAPPPPTTTVNTIPPPKRKPTVDNQHVESNNQQQTSHADKTQHHSPISTDIPPAQTQTTRVQSEQNKSNHSPPGKQAKQHHRHQSQPPTQTNHSRSEPQNSKQVPPVRHRSPSNDRNDPPSATTGKVTNPPPPPAPPEMKTTKSSKMRAAAIKQKEETREEKHKNGNFPVTKKKSTPPKSQPHPITDDEHNEKKKIPKRDKKQSHSLPKQRKSRRDDYQTEDNNSSPDEDIHDQHSRSKSKKHTAFSDPHHEKYPPLPPVRRGRGPPFYDPMYDYPYPPGHPIRPRYPYYDDYPPYPYPPPLPHRYRHLYEDAYDAPPYVAGYPDPYDGIFDYEKRKSKTKVKKHKDKKELTTDHEDHDGITGNETEREDDKKSPQSKKSRNTKKSIKDDDNDNDNDENAHERYPHKSYDAPYYDDRDMLEIWRQERNDYYKKKFKPTVHDVLYAQQFMKSDSYLENQRRRALRDTQGYYFPYKKYTLKDYKDLQKQEAQHNPYASINDPTLDRKERAKKRQEYASHLERHIENTPGQQKTPRDMPPRKPWHSSNGEPQDSEKASKRERALEYAKVQVVKKRAQKAPKNRSSDPDPTEQYVNSLFPQTHNDDEDNGQDNQSSENDDQ